VRPFFIGAVRGIEARVLPELGLDHLLVPVEGLRRGAVLANVRVLSLLATAVARVARVMRKLRPQLVVVTGGYAGGPAGLVAVLTGTRLVLQEQNALPGITTRMLSPFAKEVHLAYPESVDALPRGSRGKARVSGNPVRAPEVTERASAASELGLDAAGPVILVTGGSQGSDALNHLVLDAVASVSRGTHPLPPGLQLLWATGPAHFEGVRESLRTLGSPGWVHVVGYLDRMPLALSLVDLAVSRAGAMATSEFLAWGIPSILVPLPTAAEGHQTRNARALSDAGAALHLPQEGATGDVLWREVVGLIGDPERRERMARVAAARGRPHAARDIATSIERLLPEAHA
jgi:UDP-N-acetylglucosamine--N-acetylmuramyl-(pentapeptide) pyrophosphoryl-undecaprenol N-acetylglucosamine transferase